MKRNDDRYWYDRGYSDGVKDTEEDSKIPKVLWVLGVCALLIADQFWVLAFVSIWAVFEVVDLYDLRRYHESDPPPMWDD